MERTPLRLQQYICRSCQINARRQLGPATLGRLFATIPAKSVRKIAPLLYRYYAHDAARSEPCHQRPPPRWRPPQPHDDNVKKLTSQVSNLLKNDHVPSDEETLEVMRAMETSACRLMGQPDPEPTEEGGNDNSPTSAILSLGSQFSRDKTQRHSMANQLESINALSELAFKFLTNSNVFITSDALQSYVRLQSTLVKPASFPDIFDLFANKPVATAPVAKSSNREITFSPASPKAVAAAIQPPTADLALNTAIQIRDLPLALSIITTSYRAPAYKRLKFFKHALGPLIGACLTPVAAYTLASNMSTMQSGLPPEMFTQLASVGLGVYAAGVGTMGYVAVTSANDQMKRVTWAVGMPLWERWIREEERAAVERVAIAWGFRDKWRWGEEEGVVWDGLKEWVGVRGMVLDKVGLMEGME